ncbi:DUF4148 domain-containing protein [Chitinasiproducens palmae]|uniref:DUF4148 domain-containing protein n=1 Tax=Chitinasiproducens palmae TaxID=1770053 RepID=A0A1H2PVX9_9BURK|nr:DUF4148 domain-containing protein [Chitinasiproducens palmae]SDV51493.1 protein of unknown function [Chitinasiproducens palmae]
MKKIFRPTSMLLAGICGAAILASQPSIAQNGAQDNSGSNTTRQEKKAELKKLEANGYRPEYNDPHYPNNLQNAERRSGSPGAASQRP